MIEELKKIFNDVDFGTVDAENDDLDRFFVETGTWARGLAQGWDLVLGPKGSGKSAIFRLLCEQQQIASSRQGKISVFHILNMENPRNASVFEEMKPSIPTDENRVRLMWRLYFILIIGGFFKIKNINNKNAKSVIGYLEDSDLIIRDESTDVWLGRLLRQAIDWVKLQFDKVEEIDVKISLGANPGGRMKIKRQLTASEPSQANFQSGSRSLKNMLHTAHEALKEADIRIWLVIDRLDTAFGDNREIEKTAIRALLQAHRDLSFASDFIRISVFLRDDIFDRIVGGAPIAELSHFRQERISWEKDSLRKLLVSRLAANESICDFINKDKRDLSTRDSQDAFLGEIFPDNVKLGLRNFTTIFDAIIFGLQDGTGHVQPRDIVLFLIYAKSAQEEELDNGITPPGKKIFSPSALQKAQREVGKIKIETVIYNEYPDVRPWIKRLEEGKVKREQSPKTLAKLWEIDELEAKSRILTLKNIAFFSEKDSQGRFSYVVPHIFTAALGLVQGKEEKKRRGKNSRDDDSQVE